MFTDIDRLYSPRTLAKYNLEKKMWIFECRFKSQTKSSFEKYLNIYGMNEIPFLDNL